MTADFAVTSKRVVFPDGVRPAFLVVAEGRFVEISARKPPGVRLVDAGNLAILPGIVDSHVHVNEPGRSDWEGFRTATHAAAAGGITTIIDMPLNSIPATTDARALDAKRRAAFGQCQVDVGFWGGLVPGNIPELEALVAAGVRGIKTFLVDSGVPEFPATPLDEVDRALGVLAGRSAPLLVHAEDPEVVRRCAAALARDACDHRAWAASRDGAEEGAVEALIAILERRGAAGKRSAPIHCVHLSRRGSLDRLAAARRRGLPITGETCPHYLVLCGEEIPRGGTLYKCAPPIGTPDDREALWQALENGTLDLVASDHSPSPPARKCLESGRYDEAWGGIASLELSLPLTWSGASARGIPLERIAGWMSAAPARLAGLDDRKGAIAVGHDADFVLFDPEASFRVEPRRLNQRHPITPYAGRTLRGVVVSTWLRGKAAFERGRDGAGRFSTPDGRLL